MKKIFILLLLFPLLAYAQPDSSKLIIRFNGGYADTGSSNGVASLGASESNSRNWNVGLTVGFPFGKRWEAGVGFEYWKQKTIAKSTMYLPKQWSAMEVTETNLNLIVVKVYMSGYWRIFNRLYFNPMFSVGIGRAKGTLESFKAVREDITIDDFLVLQPISQINGAWNYESKISYDYFAMNLAPAFSFYLDRHFALNLETGSFSFSTTEWEWNNKQWLANVNPAYWKLGIIVTF